jgi:hypothetical protein
VTLLNSASERSAATLTILPFLAKPDFQEKGKLQPQGLEPFGMIVPNLHSIRRAAVRSRSRWMLLLQPTLFSGSLFVSCVALSDVPTESGLTSVTPEPLHVRQIHSGHSLTDTAAFKGTWPGHLEGIINSFSPGSANIGKSTIPGFPMTYRWEHAPGYGAADARSQIADWELLVITESIPLSVIHHIDPRGLPYAGFGLTPEPSSELAAYLQERVWEIALSYVPSGLPTTSELGDVPGKDFAGT